MSKNALRFQASVNSNDKADFVFDKEFDKLRETIPENDIEVYMLEEKIRQLCMQKEKYVHNYDVSQANSTNNFDQSSYNGCAPIPGLGWCGATAFEKCCGNGTQNEGSCYKYLPGIAEGNIWYVIDVLGYIAIVVLGFIFLPDIIRDYKERRRKSKQQAEEKRIAMEKQREKELDYSQ